MPSVRGIDLFRAAAAVSPPAGTAAIQLRFRQEALELIRHEDLIDAAYSYRIVPLSSPPSGILTAAGEAIHAPSLLPPYGKLTAGGEAIHAPMLLPESGKLSGIACAVCTLGPKLEQRVSELFARRRVSLALALDQLGNELLFDLCRRVQDRMLAETARRRLTMAGELHAGDPGLALDAQAAVLRLAHAHTIGVSLTCGQFMRPLKSMSMVLGVGVDLPPARWSRCDNCPSRPKCQFARQADAAAAA